MNFINGFALFTNGKKYAAIILATGNSITISEKTTKEILLPIDPRNKPFMIKDLKGRNVAIPKRDYFFQKIPDKDEYYVAISPNHEAFLTVSESTKTAIEQK